MQQQSWISRAFVDSEESRSVQTKSDKCLTSPASAAAAAVAAVAESRDCLDLASVDDRGVGGGREVESALP